jgi:UDP-2-acetamido-3-amino-2,3-dideoxy-glucuronate N-acetyltransferase
MEKEGLKGKFNFIHDSFKHGSNFNIGNFCVIKEDVVVGNNVTIGDYVKIMPGARIGDNVIIMDYVKFMPDTVIGNNCKIDDYVNTSGYVKIGNNVRIKRCSMIGQAVEIEDGAWIGSGVTTTRLKNPIDKDCKEEWVFIKKGAMVGSKALLLAGTTIGEGAVISAGAIVSKDCVPYGVYIGVPAKLNRMLDKPSD